MEKLFDLIEELENTVELLKFDIEEFQEIYEDGVDAMDASGGNYDDAYEMGRRHSEMFTEYDVINKILNKLYGITESN